jgi:alpha-glucoside transport system permease protein
VLLAVAALVGVPLLTAGYIILAEKLLSVAPPRRQRAIRPWLWVAPALILLVVFLVYPSLETIYLSFFNGDSSQFVGLQNYVAVFTQDPNLIAIRNNLIWLVVFTGFAVGFGLVVAVMAERVPYETAAKAVIFLPMAISFVAAAVIWRFVYDYKPPGAPQTGLLNAVLVGLIPGFQPQAWLIAQPWNNLWLIVVGIWVWTGFCTVILSAALKGIPKDILEAARVDGATEWTIFWAVTLPLISTTIAVVTTTMVIYALKAFDVVYVMTSGNYGTDVLANRMYTVMFNFGDFGQAAAIATVLLLAIIPVMWGNVGRFRTQEDVR